MTELSKNTQVPQCDKTAVMRCFSIEEMRKCAEFWNKKPIEQKYFLEFLKNIIK
jgi:hypothetical protein